VPCGELRAGRPAFLLRNFEQTTRQIVFLRIDQLARTLTFNRIPLRVSSFTMWRLLASTAVLLARRVSAHGGALNYTVGDTWYPG